MEGVILTNRDSIDRNKTDFYPTPKEVTIALLKSLEIPIGATIWECACGDGRMAEVMKEMGYNVISSDLNDMGYGEVGVNYLTSDLCECDWIITNPPFKNSVEFIKRSIEHKKPFALLFKSQYWHSKSRYDLFNEYKPSAVMPLTWRPDFLFGAKNSSPTMECIWTVWDEKPADHTEYIPLKKPRV